MGRFTSASGLGMEIDYEVYNEGGVNYPYYFLKENKPQILVLERGVVTGVDFASLLMMATTTGCSIPLGGVITLNDSFGSPQRVWTIGGAYLSKYIGPTLDSNQPSLAVSRIELMYNGSL